MSIKYKIISAVMKHISAAAKGIAILNVNSACAGPLHQPKVPDCANKLQKSRDSHE
jgi:cyclic lactone autoinducer peptide